MKLNENEKYDLKDLATSYLMEAIAKKEYSPEMVAAIAELYREVMKPNYIS